MAISRYWRLVGLCTSGNGALELSEARIYEGGVLADASATLTATSAPTSGALADLRDGVATGVVSWPHASYSAPGFALVWDFGVGAGIEFPQLRLGSGGAASTYPNEMLVQYSSDSLTWSTYGAMSALAYPGVTTLTVAPVAAAGGYTLNTLLIGVLTATALSVSTTWQSVTYGNGVFVAVASATAIAATSTDGITWVQRVLPVSATWRSVTYGNGVFVAVATGSSIAATSADGITWVQRVLPASISWLAITYGNGVFVAVANNTAIAATSADGITWVQRVLPASISWYSVTYGNGVFVAVATGSVIAGTSADGITWVQRAMPISTAWYSVTYGNGVFVAVANSSLIAATSADGITWVQRVMPVSTAWFAITYGNGVFVAVANGGDTAAISIDGITWVRLVLPVSTAWQSVAGGKGVFCALSYNSAIAATFAVVFPLSQVVPLDTVRPALSRQSAPTPERLWPAIELPVTAGHGHLREYPFFDAYNGGLGIVYGTVKEKHTPSNTPLQRRVLLIDEASRMTIRETWSDPVTGAFEFRGIKAGVKYSTVSYDHTGAYRAVIADAQIPELIA